MSSAHDAVAIRLEGVHVVLAGRPVLHDVSTRFGQGEIVAILGRNAAGKTTLVRTIAGLVPRVSGAIRLHGEPLEHVSAARRAASMAFVAQRPSLTAHFTVREAVELGRYALPRSDARVDEAIERLGLASLSSRPYRELSVGQQQRTVLARAMAQASREGTLLLDEPFASMDLAEAHRAMGVVRTHARDGLVIAVLHDVAQAAALATRVLVLEAGRVVLDAPPDVALAPAQLAAQFGVPFERTEHGVPVPRFDGDRRESGSKPTTNP